MKRIHFIWMILLLTTVTKGGYAQYRFDQFSVRDGISQNTINDIFEDDQGYLWLATQDGLNRFDGYEFKQYMLAQTDIAGIADRFVWGLNQDKLGRIWVCSRFSIYILNTRKNQVARLTGDFPSTGVEDLVIQKDTAWVLSQNRIFKVPIVATTDGEDISLKRFEEVILPISKNKAALGIVHHPGLGIVVQTLEGLLILNGQDIEKVHADFGREAHLGFDDRIAISYSGDVWLASSNGLHRFDVKSRVIERPFKELSGLPCYAVSFDSEQKIWVATESGLRIIEEGKVTTPDVRIDYEVAQMNDVYYEIHHSTNGSVWLGSSNKGLYLYDPNKEVFKYLDHTLGLDSPPVWSICQVSKQHYWLGTNSGLYEIKVSDGKTLTSEKFLKDALEYVRPVHSQYFEEKRITHIYVDKLKRKWVGVHGLGIYIFNEGGKLLQRLVFEEGNQLSNEVSSICYFKEEYWVASFKGLFRVSEDLSTYKEFSHENLNTKYFFKVFTSNYDELWMGTNLGAFKYRSDQSELTHYDYELNSNTSPSHFFVNNLVSNQGNIWFGTFGAGIDLLDESSGKFQNFSTNNGLANKVISALLLDANGNPWVSTNSGISKFNLPDSTFWNFDQSDGVLFNEAAINSSFQNAFGEMLFGTAGGLVVFNPNNIQHKREVLQPIIQDLELDYEASLHKVGYDNRLDVFPHQNVINIKFVSLDLRKSEDIRYEYKIEGVNEHWVVASSNNRLATYTTLPIGEHIFQVRAIGPYGALSDVKTLTIMVHAPFWKTLWFRLVVVLFFLIVTWLIIRAYYKDRLKRRLRSLELKQKIQAERERISRDLHDNVGTQITHVISSLDNLACTNKSVVGLGQKLEELSDFTRSTMSFLRETIWVINQDQVSIEDFIGRVEDYGKRIEENSNFNFALQYSNNHQVFLSPSLAMNAFRMAQETLTNAVKHSEGDRLEVKMNTTIYNVEMEISDNGKGFDGQKKKGHFGLENVKSRVEEIQGSISIESTSKGTNVVFSFPWRTKANA